MCSISSIICLYCLCLSVFSGGWKCHILLNVWGMHVISFVGVQKFGFTGWQSSKCLLYCWLFSLVHTHPRNIYFSVSRLKYNPVAVPDQESTTTLHSFTNITTSSQTHTLTHTAADGAGGGGTKIKHLVFIMRREMESRREGKDERAR